MTKTIHHIKNSVSWDQFPNMADVFRNRPAVNFLWIQLVEFIRLEQATGYGDLDKFPKLQAAAHQFMSELPLFVTFVIQNRSAR